MADPLHPADPVYLGLQLSTLRFEVENGRDPNHEERLGLIRDRFSCTLDEAEAVLAAAERTGELETMARDMLADILPTMFGGAFAHMARRS